MENYYEQPWTAEQKEQFVGSGAANEFLKRVYLVMMIGLGITAMAAWFVGNQFANGEWLWLMNYPGFCPADSGVCAQWSHPQNERKYGQHHVWRLCPAKWCCAGAHCAGLHRRLALANLLHYRCHLRRDGAGRRYH